MSSRTLLMFRRCLSNPRKRKRRDRLGITADILEIARNGCLKTQIMYRSSLSFSQLNEYLGFLLEATLLKSTKESTKVVYRTTRKGLDFLQNYYKIMDLLRQKD